MNTCRIYYLMNSHIYNFSEIMEDIKQDITGNQCKIIMDTLMDTSMKMNTIPIKYH